MSLDINKDDKETVVSYIGIETQVSKIGDRHIGYCYYYYCHCPAIYASCICDDSGYCDCDTDCICYTRDSHLDDEDDIDIMSLLKKSQGTSCKCDNWISQCVVCDEWAKNMVVVPVSDLDLDVKLCDPYVGNYIVLCRDSECFDVLSRSSRKALSIDRDWDALQGIWTYSYMNTYRATDACTHDTCYALQSAVYRYGD